jgi:hypothetical protein
VNARGLLKNRSYANVTSTLALLIALGGTSVAATSLAHNSVGTKQLQKGAVTAVKLHSKSVTASKVKRGSLVAKDFKSAQLIQPVAYAHVLPDGSVVAADSKGITSAQVSVESTAAYCFHNLGFTVHDIEATEDYNTTQGETGNEVTATQGNPQFDCAGKGTQAEVVTSVHGLFAHAGFFVVFY